MKCANCQERENYRDWDTCKVCTGLAIQFFLRTVDNETEQLITKLMQAAQKATPEPWTLETQEGDLGNEYITGHITSPNHDYAGNYVERTDSIMSPGTMTRDDGEFLVLCTPQNILRLIGAIRLRRNTAKEDDEHNLCRDRPGPL